MRSSLSLGGHGPTYQRFISNIEVRDGHWFWTGSTFKTGYGKFRAVGSEFHAHRVSWMLEHNLTAEGLYITQTCGEDLCVDPTHLSSRPVATRSSLYDG
jgi:hypothetical protein